MNGSQLMNLASAYESPHEHDLVHDRDLLQSTMSVQDLAHEPDHELSGIQLMSVTCAHERDVGPRAGTSAHEPGLLMDGLTSPKLLLCSEFGDNTG